MGYAKPTAARLVDQRARRRATQALVERHRDEFTDLYDWHRREAEQESDALADSPEAAEHYGNEPVRLKTGRRNPGERAGDRIDVARCPHCVKHHDRNHACLSCGAMPNHALTIPDDGDVDEIAVERAMKGEPVRLTTRERAEAVRLMAARGDGPTKIATTLRMNGSRVNALLGATA